MTDPNSAEFAARRLAARARLDAIDMGASDPYRRAWFAAVYETAGDDPAQIPWADLAPHSLLASWLAKVDAPEPGARALDIGCGLGDNAAAIAAKGWQVTGFDLLPRAIRWAASRFPAPEFVAADLFNPPGEWSAAFDLVHECYTLQALPDAPRAEAIRQIARFVRPGGTLLVIARARDGAGPVAGPPWPLARQEIMSFAAHGLRCGTIEQLPDPTDGKPHWRAAFRR
ncbi:MAG: class I SAM-dependent methyltransferase [Alphaproteobacteria bacterium]|nr:MAG: class I SAM-dependent methyltransferase [Alphaproteobacteria bacterium]